MDRIKSLLACWACFPSKRSKRPSQQQQQAPAKTMSPLSTSSTDDPISIVISHGAFQTQYHYQLFMDALRQHTELDRVLCPQQSCSGPNPPEGCFHSDVEMLHATIRDEILSGRDVLLICHSYGGIPGCESLANLPTTSPTGARLGRILGIVFVSAFVAEAGQSLITSKIAGRAAWVRIEGALSYINDPGPTLFSRVSSPTQITTLVSNLVPQASSSFTTLTTSETWKFLPSYYIRCTNDQAMVPREQDYFITRLRAGCAKAQIREMPADHAPFASMPAELAKLTEEIVGELHQQRDPNGPEDV